MVWRELETVALLNQCKHTGSVSGNIVYGKKHVRKIVLFIMDIRRNSI